MQLKDKCVCGHVERLHKPTPIMEGGEMVDGYLGSCSARRCGCLQWVSNYEVARDAWDHSKWSPDFPRDVFMDGYMKGLQQGWKERNG